MGTGPFPLGIEEELARITTAADRTYRRLAQLGELNRTQGFLGQADMRQWEQMQRRWTQFEAEAATRVTAARAHEAAVAARPYVPHALHVRMIASAQERVRVAEERQVAFQTLTPTMPAPFTTFPRPGVPTPRPSPFIPTPPSGAFTPMGILDQLARVNVAANRTFTTLQDLGAKNRRQGFLGEADMRQWQSATAQWTRFSADADARVRQAQARFDALDPAGPLTQVDTRRRERAQERLDEAMRQRSALRFLRAEMDRGGPPTLGIDPEERGPGMFARGFARFQHAMHQARDLALGIGVAQTIQHGVHLADQRARGLVSVGMLTGQQMQSTPGARDVTGGSGLGAQLDALRESPLKMQAHDIVRAMQAYGRLAGTTVGIDRGLKFGIAQGIDPAQAAQMDILASRMTTGPNPLATMLGAFRQATGGRAGTMSGAVLTEESLSMAEQAAARGIRMPSAFFGNMAGMLTNTNPELMQVPGAMARTFGQLTQGLATAQDDPVYAMKMRAMANLYAERKARGQSTVFDLNGVKVDLGTNYGREMALEEAGYVTDEQGNLVVANAIAREGRGLSGGRPDLDPDVFRRYTLGGKFSHYESERIRQEYLRTGQFPSAAAMPQARGTQEASDDAAIQRRNQDPNFKNVDMLRADAEKGLELVGGVFLETALKVQKAIANTGEAFETGIIPKAKDLMEALNSLRGETIGVLGVFQLLSAQNPYQAAVGAGMIATGMLTGPQNLSILGEAYDPGPGDLARTPQPWGWGRYNLGGRGPTTQPLSTSP